MYASNGYRTFVLNLDDARFAGNTHVDHYPPPGFYFVPDCLVIISATIFMAESVQVPELAIRPAEATASEAPRHAAVIRITHWITALSVFALVLSGIAILLAHPRL